MNISQPFKISKMINTCSKGSSNDNYFQTPPIFKIRHHQECWNLHPQSQQDTPPRQYAT